jgi:hypothetical protein
VGSLRLGSGGPRYFDFVRRGIKPSFRFRASSRFFEGDSLLRRERPFGNLPGNGGIIPRFRCSAKVRLFFPERFLDLDFNCFLDFVLERDCDRFRNLERRMGDRFLDRDCNRVIYKYKYNIYICQFIER